MGTNATVQCLNILQLLFLKVYQWAGYLSAAEVKQALPYFA